MIKFLIGSFISVLLGAIAFHPYLAPRAPLWLSVMFTLLLWSLALNVVLAVPTLRHWLSMLIRKIER